MFQNRDPNAPAAPAVHVPMLNGGTKASCFSPTVFRAASSHALTKARASTRQSTSAVSTSSSASQVAPVGRELHVVECGHAHVRTPSATESVPVSNALLDPNRDYLLSNEDFVEELVREVRLTCQRANNEQVFLAETDGPLRRDPQGTKPVFVCPGDVRRPSPVPRDPANADTEAAVLPHTPSPVGARPHRARSPSPASSSRSFAHSPTMRLGFDEDTDMDAALTASRPYRRQSGASHCHRGLLSDGLEPELNGSPSTVALAASSRTSSPGPRLPQTGPYSAGGALCRSLRRNRSAGVSREVSPDVVIELDAHEKDYDGEEEEEATADKASARAYGGAFMESVATPEDRLDSGRAHPKWTPRAVSEPRPAWNQRCPPPRTRPVVSARGTTPARDQKTSASTGDATAAIAASPRHHPQLSAPSTSTGATAATPTATATSTAARTRTVRGVAGEGRDVNGRPASGVVPARTAHRRSHSCPSVDSGRTKNAVVSPRTRSPPHRAPFATSSPHVLCSADDMLGEALTRAARAEARVEALEATVQALAERHEETVRAWSNRCVQLTRQVEFVLEWARAHPHAPQDGGTPAQALEMTTWKSTDTPDTTPTHRETAEAKHMAHDDGDSEALVISPGGEDADVDGATPTPVRPPGQASGRQSSSQVRVPPSPPLVLQLQGSLPE